MPRPKILATIILVAITVRVGIALAMGNAVVSLPGIEDQISYNTLSLRVLHGYGFTFGQDWWPGTPAGTPTAHWSYLYTQVLAAVHAISSEQPLAARLAQAIAGGVLTPLLLYRVAQHLFPYERSPRQPASSAVVAAAWGAVYGYLAYYAAALMTETLYILGILWVLDCSLRLLATPASRGSAFVRWAELGVAIALTVMLRQVFLPFAVMLLPYLVLVIGGREPGGLRAGWRRAAGGALLTGLVATTLILPITTYNYQRFGRVVLLNTNAGFAFYWANHPIHEDRFVGILPEDGPSYAELVPLEIRGLNEAERDGALLRRGLSFVLDDPTRYLRLSLSRIPVYFMFWPAATSSPLSNLVRVTSFGIAIPFMIAGIGLWSWPALRGKRPPAQWASGTLLLLFAAVYTAVHLLSWSLIRYRLPVDTVLLVFAGHALATLWERLRQPAAGRLPEAVAG